MRHPAALICGLFFILTIASRASLLHDLSVYDLGRISCRSRTRSVSLRSWQRLHRNGSGPAIYFTILTSHTILAASSAFVVATYRARAFDRHKNLARLVYPVWLYVSITGVIVYIFLYQLYPAR
jgi:hypothetical protein